MISVPLRSIQQTRWTRVALTGIRRVVPLSTVCVVVMAFGAGGSSAALTTRAETPSKEWVVDGSVMALAATSSALYVGGDFTAIGPPTGAWVSVDATGAVAPVRAEIYDSVSDAVSDGAGGWFIQGEIASVGGVDHSGFTHLKPNGRLDRNWHVRVGGTISAFARHGKTLYIGGDFIAIDGAKRLDSLRSIRRPESSVRGIRRLQRGTPTATSLGSSSAAMGARSTSLVRSRG